MLDKSKTLNSFVHRSRPRLMGNCRILSMFNNLCMYVYSVNTALLARPVKIKHWETGRPDPGEIADQLCQWTRLLSSSIHVSFNTDCLIDAICFNIQLPKTLLTIPTLVETTEIFSTIVSFHLYKMYNCHTERIHSQNQASHKIYIMHSLSLCQSGCFAEIETYIPV